MTVKKKKVDRPMVMKCKDELSKPASVLSLGIAQWAIRAA